MIQLQKVILTYFSTPYITSTSIAILRSESIYILSTLQRIIHDINTLLLTEYIYRSFSCCYDLCRKN
jgi:hypothetical protein